jgi:(R)-2-hydroxyglutarate---pyruvate transhydrogenase
MYELVDVVRDRLAAAGLGAAQGVVPVGYGHMGDSNVHLNVSTRGHGAEGAAVRAAVLVSGGGAEVAERIYSPLISLPPCAPLQAALEPFVFEWTIAQGGSISAEHGLGQSKAAWLSRAKPAPVVAVMRGLKALLDPDGILNPGKVLVD